MLLLSCGIIETEIDVPDVRRGSKLTQLRHFPSHRWISFAGVTLFIVGAALLGMPWRQASTALPLLTVLMAMLVLRNYRIEGKRRRANSTALTKKFEALESIIRSLDPPKKSPWVGRLLIRRHQLASGIDAGAKWDVRPGR